MNRFDVSRACSTDEILKAVRALLTAGADPNFSGGVHDRPLHIAAGKAHPTIVNVLLDAGADRMSPLPEMTHDSVLCFSCVGG